MLPFFFHDDELIADTIVHLDESSAWHVVQVLRMGVGERLILTNGRGAEAEAAIREAGKKSCAVRVESVKQSEPVSPSFHLGIAFTKNAGRNEWLLEKAVELSAASITPLVTARGQKVHTKQERWRTILISAALQSQQVWLPELRGAEALEKVVGQKGEAVKLMAHCLAERPRQPLPVLLQKGQNVVLLIGPEGDFTPAEITLAEAHGFRAVSLGNTRLRTETAALAALSFFHLLNDETA